MKQAVAVVRSFLFALLQVLITPPYALVAILTFPLPPLARYHIIAGWARLFVWLARTLCGIRYRVEGMHNIPRMPVVFMAKHQSAWETLAFQAILPPHVMVIKRELLWIPFFGWGLAMMSPIAIDRSAGRQALKQLQDQGKARLGDGFGVVIYPEGTRTAPGKPGRYHTGGGWLAVKAQTPVIPIAHNAGYLWPRNSFVKRPGVITVSIGPPIGTEGRRPDAVIDETAAWIEREVARIGDGASR